MSDQASTRPTRRSRVGPKPGEVRYFRHDGWEVEVGTATFKDPGWEVLYPAEGHAGYDTVQEYPTLKAMREASWRERRDVYPCCGLVGGCGGPCAAFPCWELTT